MQKVLKVISTESKEMSYKTLFNLVNNKALKTKAMEHRLKVIGKWVKLTRKMMHFANLKSKKNIQQWKHFATSLIKKDKNPRLFIQYRTTKLFKNYILFHLCSKQ